MGKTQICTGLGIRKTTENEFPVVPPLVCTAVITLLTPTNPTRKIYELTAVERKKKKRKI